MTGNEAPKTADQTQVIVFYEYRDNREATKPRDSGQTETASFMKLLVRSASCRAGKADFRGVEDAEPDKRKPGAEDAQ